MSGLLAVRFDVDSVTCVERGIPRLRTLARELDVRFTFFVNMGHSFNWTHNLRHLARRRGSVERPAGARTALPTRRKLGVGGVLKTVFLNPELGERYRSTFDALAREGHELGLHGGADHVVWQRSLDEMDEDALERLFRPAYDTFRARYGTPAGFASPGFVTNDLVLELLDREGFAYASDLPGEAPFRPTRSDGRECRHFQVPVTAWGAGRVPLIEEGLAMGLDGPAIVRRVVESVRSREYSLLYGHPYVEGVHSGLLAEALRELGADYEIVTVSEYLTRWMEDHG